MGNDKFSPKVTEKNFRQLKYLLKPKNFLGMKPWLNIGYTIVTRKGLIVCRLFQYVI